MSQTHNFASLLLNRLSTQSRLADAATGETVGYSQLRQLVPGFGAALVSLGLNPGDRILLSCALSPASSIAYLGAMYAGFVPVPLEQSVLESSGNALIQMTGARAVWSESNCDFPWLRSGKIVFIPGHPRQIATESAFIPPAACQKTDLATLIATSGSSAAPRFVMVSHENLAANCEAIVRSQDLGDDERAMLILPISYCFGASVLHSHLYQGGEIVFDRRFMFPDKVLHAIAQYECTTFAGVPTVYNILLRRSNLSSIPIPSLRRFLQAGGPLAKERVVEMTAAVPSARFYVMYGQTEATARIAVLDPERLADKLGSVGRPLDNLTVRIVDEFGEEAPVGRTGEIVVKGPSIAMGYFNDPDESERTFKDGWLQTKDIGHLDEDGYLWIEGRKSAFLKMRGVRISFAEVEATVASVPGVYECLATAVAHPEVGEALALYIVADKHASNVAERVRASLPTRWTCNSIDLVPEIPKTSRGKVSRASLSA
jgi:acyl-CoA synthetase (AMP-forming)/AMP-acid ligase II